jgi:hypothetical protein
MTVVWKFNCGSEISMNWKRRERKPADVAYIKGLVQYLRGGIDDSMRHQNLHSWTDTMLSILGIIYSSPIFGMPETGLIWLQWRSAVNR